MGVLALFCSLFVLVLLTFLFWPGSELVAKPTDIVESVSEVVLSEPVIIPVISGNITKTVAVSFDEPRPKISPELVKELKELKKDRKRAKVLINVRDDAALVALQKTVSDAGGQITQSFSVGDVAVVDLPADKVEEVSQAVGVEEISVEREYVAFLFDRIPVFGVDKVWESNITGKNVKIAVLDTGVGPHDNISVYGARSFVSGEDTADLNGHGTHVAGIAQGVARGAQIYNAKVLSRTGSGSTSQIIAGINWAADNDVDIISMSFGGMFTELDGPLASAVKDAIQRGVVFVVASGNCRQGCGGFFGVTTPGNVKEVITVGAVDDGNVVASFSSGDAFSDYIKPDITAPGKDITSTWLNNGWKTLSGTSMSTPFVSGVVALMLEKESLTHSQVKAKLEGTAIDLGTAGKDTSYGAGLVNVSWLISVVVNVTINQTNATNVTNTTIPVNETIPVPVSNETEPAPANATRPAPVSFDTESRLVTGDVGVFAFTGMNNASFVREGSISDKIAFYAKENSTIFVEELLFDNIFNYSEYLYQNIPLTSDNLTFINGDNNYIEYENRYLWYNDYALYLVDAYLTNESELIDFLDDYSLKTSNNVGKDFDDNLENLKLLDNRLFSAISLSNAQTSSKSEDFDPQWGGSGTSSAAQLYFGKTEPETFWSKSYNWYKASTTRMSTLSFEIINIDSGDDLDLYVYDYTGTYLLCHSDNTGNANEKCPVSKTVNTNWLFYIVIYPYTIGGTYAAGDIKLTAPDCSVTWVGNAECSTTGNDVLKNKQKTDCTTAKEVYDDCDRLTGSGTPYCSGGDAVRTDTTGYCSSGSCRSSSSTVTDDTCTSDEKCSGGVCVAKTCIDYSSNQGSCGWSNYNALDSTECINGNAVDCDRYGGIYCWKNLDICTSDEECHNPPTSSAHCDVIPCTVSSVSWDTTSAVVGSSVGITVQGSHCSNSNYVTFDVFENDCLGAAEYNESQIDTTSLNETGSNETNLTAQGVCNDAVNYRPSQAYFSSNRARTTWTAEYQSDGWGNPDYYAWAYLNGDTNDDTGSGNELTVTCGDSDVDGYSNSGGDCGNSDCNDGDANIHPGATERCNNIDDDCDGSRDEGIDLQTDANNCGSCGNACGSGGSCHDGQCYSTQCAGYADTIDGCSTKGEFKKDDEKIYKCNNVLWWGTLLC
ncbi:MAG: S8 family serine peptidase, partial [Candidatus Woesearchaeota archaeon]|nr:S8 family serine peptidase [Candidatus Woesearchaeota archaeon]